MITAAARAWGLLVVLAGTMLIDALEVSATIVALPEIADRLGLPWTTAAWLVSGFAVGFGGLVLFGARLTAVLGRRRVYLGALALFVVACAAGALTTDPAVLIATRFVRGACAALTAPTGLAIIMTTFADARERGRALSVYTLMGASGFAVGLVVSGLLTAADWRWVVVFPAPAALALFVLGLRLVPGGDGGRDRYDLPGAACLAGALLALVYGILRVPAHGWDAYAAFGVAAALLVAFVRVECVAPWPLARLTVLAHRPLVRAMLGAAALNGSYLGLLVVCTVQWQTGAGWSPFATALAMLPASLPLALAAPFAGRMINRFGTDRLIALGAFAPPAGYALYLWRGEPGGVADVLPTTLLVGIGFVLCFTALNAQATTGLPATERPVASGVYQTAVQAAAAVMTALVATLSVTGGGYQAALWLVTAVGALGALSGVPALAHASNVLVRRVTN
jgi:MFS family permease